MFGQRSHFERIPVSVRHLPSNTDAGWLAASIDSGSAQAPAALAAPSSGATQAQLQDPQLRDALKRVRQLDGALDAACARAAAVAEKGRALEAALEAAEEQGAGASEGGKGGSEGAPAGGEGGPAGLEAAMRRERRRLLQEDRLLSALGQDGDGSGLEEVADADADAAVPSAEQERLVEALLSQADGGAAGASAAAPSPYDVAAMELAAIDARLAELRGQQQQQFGAGAAGQPAVQPAEGCMPAPASQVPNSSTGDDSWQQHVVAAKAGFLRRVLA